MLLFLFSKIRRAKFEIPILANQNDIRSFLYNLSSSIIGQEGQRAELTCASRKAKMSVPVARFSKARHQKIFRNNVGSSKGHEEDYWRSILQNTDTLKSLEPKFHLQSLGDASNPDIIFFRVLGVERKVDLAVLRFKLVMFNLLVLLASMTSFQGWIWVDQMFRETTKGLSQAEKDRDPFHIPHKWLHDYNHIVAHGFANTVGLLYGCAVSLIGAYALYGSFFMELYGKSFNYTRMIVYTAPLLWILGAFLICVAYQFLALRTALNTMDCDLIRPHVTYMRMNALMEMRKLLNDHATLGALALAMAAMVLVIQSLLPFFMYDLPFQRAMDLDELVVCYDQKGRKVQRFKECKYGDQTYSVLPYRSLSAAFTAMLYLCDPGIRDFHRSS